MALLGIEPDMAHDQARRQYLRSIKQYRPERQPEEFARRRQAWELVEELFPRDMPASAPTPVAEKLAGGDGSGDGTMSGGAPDCGTAAEGEAAASEPANAGGGAAEPEPATAEGGAAEPEAATAGAAAGGSEASEPAAGAVFDLGLFWQASRGDFDERAWAVACQLCSGEYPFNEMAFDALMNIAISGRSRQLAGKEFEEAVRDAAGRHRRDLQNLPLSMQKLLLAGEYLRCYRNYPIFRFLREELLDFRAGEQTGQADRPQPPPRIGAVEFQELGEQSPTLHSYVEARRQHYQAEKGWRIVAEPPAPARAKRGGGRYVWVMVTILVMAVGSLSRNCNLGAGGYHSDAPRMEQKIKIWTDQELKDMSHESLQKLLKDLDRSKTENTGNE